MAEEVHSITDAPLKHSVEQHSRKVRYAWAMATRAVCFVLAAVVAMVWETWWSIAFVAAAVVLPYVAVIDANAGGERYIDAKDSQVPPTQRTLPASAATSQEEPLQWWEEDEHAPERSGGTIDGELLVDHDDQLHAEDTSGTDPITHRRRSSP